MKYFMNIVGVTFIVLGILVLSYHGFTYTKSEKVAQFGDIQVTAKKEETISVPPLLGGLSIAAGIAILLIGRFNKK